MAGIGILKRWMARVRKGNSRVFWEREYGDSAAGRKWASGARLSFYDFAAEALPREPLRILDIGSGLGHGGRRLMEICPLWKVDGFEISRTAAEQAVIPTRCGDLLRESLPSGYDFLLMIQTLEHFRETSRVLSRVVPAAGRGVVITVPYRGKLNRKHLASLDESSFASYPRAVIQLRKRLYEKDGSQKIDMRVLIPAEGPEPR
jgi:SAM-dependent methyltransferase